MRYSEAGLNLTKQFEGLRLRAYLDSVGVPTIGYGHTKGVKPGDVCTEEQATAFLVADVQDAVDAVNKNVTVQLTQPQFDALVDFVFNLGVGNFRSSTLLKKLNGRDYVGAGAEFGRWNRAGGVVVAGLARRRLAEQKMFGV